MVDPETGRQIEVDLSSPRLRDGVRERRARAAADGRAGRAPRRRAPRRRSERRRLAARPRGRPGAGARMSLAARPGSWRRWRSSRSPSCCTAGRAPAPPLRRSASRPSARSPRCSSTRPPGAAGCPPACWRSPWRRSRSRSPVPSARSPCRSSRRRSCSCTTPPGSMEATDVQPDAPVGGRRRGAEVPQQGPEHDEGRARRLLDGPAHRPGADDRPRDRRRDARLAVGRRRHRDRRRAGVGAAGARPRPGRPRRRGPPLARRDHPALGRQGDGRP